MEFTTFKAVTVAPAEVVISPLNAGSLAPEIVPVLISEASMLLFVKVCASFVPTSALLGVATTVVIFAAVRSTMPFAPGSASPEAFWPIKAQLFGDAQPNKFCPAVPLVLKKRSPRRASGRKARSNFRGTGLCRVGKIYVSALCS